jgi:hypothetical protein
VRQRFGLVELRPIRLSKQVELEFEEVVQRQAKHGTCDRWLSRHHVLDILQPLPAGAWRQHGQGNIARKRTGTPLEFTERS